MRYLQQTQNENGSALLVSMLILGLLTIIGIAVTRTTDIELQIAGNDRMHKTAFYEADSGTEYGAELLEQNISCPVGFSEDGDGNGERTINGTIKVTNLDFWLNDDIDDSDLPLSDTNRDAVYTPVSGETPHTNLLFGSRRVKGKGMALQMAAGYEGVGKNVSSGGFHLIFDIYSRHQGINNTQSTVRSVWRHIIGQEGTCPYPPQ
jgi:hypothetical protein